MDRRVNAEAKAMKKTWTNEPSRRRALCPVAAAVFVATFGLADRASARDDIVVLLASDGVAEMVLNDFALDNTITQGVLSLQTDDAHCVALPDAPCHYTLNVLRTTISSFRFSDQDVNDAVAVVNGPIDVEDHGEGLFIPAGTPVFVAMTLDGERRGVESTTPTGINVMLDVVDQQIAITGNFVGNLDDVSVEATLLATGQAPFANLPPVANAGPDQTVTCGAKAHLDGSASSDPNGNLYLLAWSEGGVNLGFGPVLDVDLPEGVHTILLEAFDTYEGRGTDTVVVNVVHDHVPPTFASVPAGRTVQDCSQPDIGTANATDNCGVVSVVSDAPAVFGLGTTTVTWTATDAAGNEATATEQIFAQLGDDPSCCPAGTNIILGTQHADWLNGTNVSDCILGLGGPDVIRGAGAKDFLSGGNDADNLSGGDGDDYLVGGAGPDLLSGGDGRDEMYGTDGADNLQGGFGDDFLDGGNDGDLCDGDTGDDDLVGGAGPDVLLGGIGDDDLSGGPGNDRLEDVLGHNTLDGGDGIDLCIALPFSTVQGCP